MKEGPIGFSIVLKACIFATGLAGIVAEYIMATLASYFLGNTVLHWTLTVSLMLFAMGVGSRISKNIRLPLLESFVIIEFILSILCALSASLVYLLSAYIQSIWPVIYIISIGIGILIGLEIPIATRLNDYFEELRINISSLMEKDYYGALLGGLLFAFVALPYLGLSYTPIALGTINFIIAMALFGYNFNSLKYKKSLTFLSIVILTGLLFLFFIAEPIVFYGEQSKYVDKVIYSEQTPYQRIVLTQWKDNYWLYLDGNEQFSSFDEERYHEPLVHPAMSLSVSHRKVLILGGGDGLAAREVLKYPDVKNIVLVDIDPAITRLGRTNRILTKLNDNALNDNRTCIKNQDAYKFLLDDDSIFDVIIIDFPDPKTVGLARLYTRQFYKLVIRHLTPGGVMVTQATSPFFSKQAFLSILKTMRSIGIPAIAYHNHIPTMGEWGWALGINAPGLKHSALKKRLSVMSFENVSTRFINQEAMQSMLNFGKGTLDKLYKVEVNDNLNMYIYNYYKKGSWDMY
ncbi:MAG: polyamine aminopropyltransferase [Spirochaetota bacterium]|nr:polyamine aminopropyltransferase [Spirochaetota bacterium]